MTNEKIYQYVLKYSYVFDQIPNILDLITVQINKLWEWEYGGRFRKFTNDDDSKFAKRKNSVFSNTFDNGFFSLNTHNIENAFNYLSLALR